MKKRWTVTVVLIMMMVPAFLMAQDKADPLMGAQEGTADNWKKSVLIWSEGVIDSIDKDGVVINDSSFEFSSATKFYSDNDTALTVRNFSAGTPVRYVLDKDRRTIVSMIKIRRLTEKPAPAGPGR